MTASLPNSVNRLDFDIQPNDWSRLANLCGPSNRHLRQLEQAMGVSIYNRGNHFSVEGQDGDKARAVLFALYDMTETDELTPERIHLCLRQVELGAPHQEAADERAAEEAVAGGMIGGRALKPCGLNQMRYLKNMTRYTLNFAVGPAGTGKTYLAVARAVTALNNGLVKHLVLVRPVVEAGEHLGFLPGDLVQKLDPYLKPLYDALHDFLGFERVNQLIADGVIEIAPLAYMRGRSLNHAFIILDEAQNTTCEQMKMFLTRMGFGSFAVVTGDTTQVDLPERRSSGLAQAIEVLGEVNDVGFTFFNARDVMRHALVRKIIDAYDRSRAQNGSRPPRDDAEDV